MRTPALLTVLALALAGPALAPVLVPGLTTGPAAAAPATCEGRALTHTGTPGAPLVTTEFDDVVQAGGASSVSTLGGNDIVCQDVDPGGRMVVSTGPGNDRVLLGDPFAAGTALSGWVGTVDVDLGDGTDQLRAQMVAHGTFSGGPGGDLFRMADTDRAPKARRAGRSRLTLDLAAGTLAVAGTAGSTATAFEDVLLTGFQTTRVRGDGGVNRIAAQTCAGTLSGAGGVDQLSATKGVCTLPRRQRVVTFRGGRGDDTVFGSRHTNRLYGDGGRDRLLGDFGDDLIVGGAGRDRAVGGPGRDRCQAERRRTCERR